MAKHFVESSAPPESLREPLGLGPAVLAKRKLVKKKSSAWCLKNVEYDPWCDEDNPKMILPKDVYKAASEIGKEMQVTPLVKSKHCAELGFELYYKLECFNHTHSYLERGAHYVLARMKDDQKREGVYTASLGEWGKALALKARRFKVPLTVVLPDFIPAAVLNKIRSFGATAITHGTNLAEAKRHAFVLKNENKSGTFINGYDHPHVIAGSGVIGIEILEQLPQTDAILIPVGGGGLIAGISTLAKQRKPKTLIYGVEPDKCCSFFKAMENERPYKTECGFSVAQSLAVPTVGVNAFHTAVSLIDKMVLTDDNWIAQAILHLAEVENMVVDGTGAISLSVLLTKPDHLPELQGKTVVCVITSSNIDTWLFSLALQRALEIDGRKILVTVKVESESIESRLNIFNVISNVGVNILDMETENPSFIETDVRYTYLHLVCETRNLAHACALKRVLTRLFPGQCDFLEEPFSPIPICICSPKKCVM